MSNVDKLLRYPAGVCSNPAMRNKRHGVKNNLRVYEIIKPVFYSLSANVSSDRTLQPQWPLVSACCCESEPAIGPFSKC